MMRFILLLSLIFNFLILFGQSNKQTGNVNGSENDIVNSSIAGNNVNIGGIQNISSISNYGLSKMQFDTIINLLKANISDTVNAANINTFQIIDLINQAISMYIDSINLIENSFTIKQNYKDSLNALKLEQANYYSEFDRYKIYLLEKEIELQKLNHEKKLSELNNNVETKKIKRDSIWAIDIECLEKTTLTLLNKTNKNVNVYIYTSHEAMVKFYNPTYNIILNISNESTLYKLDPGVYSYGIYENFGGYITSQSLTNGQFKIIKCKDNFLEIKF